MADVDGVAQIQMRRERGDVGGIGVHVVAGGGLARAAMAAPIVGDDAVALLEEEQHLCIPVVARQGPAVMEHDWLTGAPVLVEEGGTVRGW